jgi:hypothetical protein
LIAEDFFDESFAVDGLLLVFPPSRISIPDPDFYLDFSKVKNSSYKLFLWLLKMSMGT